MEIPEDPSKNLLRDIGFLILGLIALAFGSNFLVSGAVDLARIWGLSSIDRSYNCFNRQVHQNWQQLLWLPTGRLPTLR